MTEALPKGFRKRQWDFSRWKPEVGRHQSFARTLSDKGKSEEEGWVE